MLPADFWLAWEYHLREQNRRDELFMGTMRIAAARILSPFVKGGIRDLHRFWPLPFDDSGEAPKLPEGEDLQASIENIKLIADQWLKG